MRRAPRKDANHTEIVSALRGVGADVVDLAAVGEGVPDILVAFRGVLYLLELKTAKGKLTPAEEAWHQAWRGPVAIVRSVDEALSIIGAA